MGDVKREASRAELEAAARLFRVALQLMRTVKGGEFAPEALGPRWLHSARALAETPIERVLPGEKWPADLSRSVAFLVHPDGGSVLLMSEVVVPEEGALHPEGGSSDEAFDEALGPEPQLLVLFPDGRAAMGSAVEASRLLALARHRDVP